MFGYLSVLPMCVGSAVLMAVVSLLTPPPSKATVEKYFPTSSKHTQPSRAENSVYARQPVA
jgi:hypothetical protein